MQLMIVAGAGGKGHFRSQECEDDGEPYLSGTSVASGVIAVVECGLDSAAQGSHPNEGSIDPSGHCALYTTDGLRLTEKWLQPCTIRLGRG
jgi:hypothetical protein